MMLRVAIIGCGNIGRTHAVCYAEHPRARLIACGDIVREKADSFAEQFGLKPYSSVPDLLNSEALEAGKAVLCEKPISNDLAKARDMVATAARRGLYFGVNLNHRFAPVAYR